MPDLPNRDDLESTFAEQLGKAGQKIAKDVIDLVGDPPRDLTADEWRAVALRFHAALQPQLEAIYQRSAGSFYEHLGVGRDDDQIETYASRWARDHATSLTNGLIDTSKQRLDALRADLIAGRTTPAYFKDGVRQLFGASRAEMIASTETTRAAVAAELQVVNGLRSYGLKFKSIWQTSNDDATCPICAPRNGKEQGDGWRDPPPAHPRCRCWLNTEPIDVEGLKK